MNARALAVKVLPPAAKSRLLLGRRQLVDTVASCRLHLGRLGPLPAFLIIGFGKCGTTELYDRLQEHPNVHPSLRKEVNYFIFRHDMGSDWYRAHFATPPRRGDREPFVVGEASPGYVLNPHAPARIAELVPEVKLIVLLRDPVARAYSHYQHQRRLGAEPLDSFEAALAAEQDRLRGEAERVLREPNYRGYAWYVDSYVRQGIYADYLPWWLDQFPREQLMIIQSETFFRHPAATLQEVTRFLELPDWSPRERKQHKAFAYSRMQPETEARLREYFAPHNDRLADLVGVDYGWNDRINAPHGVDVPADVSLSTASGG